MVSDILEYAGFGFLCLAAFMLSATLGVAALGISCLIIGFAYDRKGDA